MKLQRTPFSVYDNAKRTICHAQQRVSNAKIQTCVHLNTHDYEIRLRPRNLGCRYRMYPLLPYHLTDGVISNYSISGYGRTIEKASERRAGSAANGIQRRKVGEHQLFSPRPYSSPPVLSIVPTD